MIIAGYDPSFTNWGFAYGTIDEDTLEVDIASIKLVETEPSKGKKVRVNSDDMSRARKLWEECKNAQAISQLIFAEIPSGAQNARAATSFGVVTGILSCHSTPIIQVQFNERAAVVCNRKSVTKDEVIDWAVSKYPNLPWITSSRSKRDNKLTDDNEHMADAIAIIHAGIQTDAFKTLIATRKSFRNNARLGSGD